MNETEDLINWPLERKVDEFIEIVFGGKHHIQKFEMKHNHAVIVPYGSMATVDMNCLTTAVFAAHQLGLRVDIENHGMRGIRLLCHSRSVREGSLMKRHPTIVEALKQYGVEVITKAEHDAAIAKLQKENEELRARIEELKELANSVCLAEDGVWCYGVNKENWFDAKNRILKGCKDGD